MVAGTALFGFADQAARAQAPLTYQSSTYETSGLPGFRLSTQPDLTSPSDPSIATFYGNPASPAAATPSARITALARSLENDPDRIYQFVRNSIAFEPQFGLHKGADGVLLDGSGGAFDQAQLMVELLRASGRPARFALGTVTLGPEAASILRVDTAHQACELLATAGTPATVNTLTDCATVSGAVANVTMMHVWVEAQLTSGGPWYAFDPSLKQTDKITGVDLWASAGTGAASAWSNVSSGVSSGQPNLTGVNAANIQGDLAGYAQTLQADLIANHTDKSLEQLTGGWDIKRVTDAPRVTSLPGYTASTRWTGEVPDIYRAKLTLQTTNFAHVFDLPSIYGWRVQGQMQGNTEEDQTPSGGFVVAVRKCEHLNAAATAYFTKLAVSPCETQNTVEGDPVNFATWDRRLTLTINHPYVASRTGASITGSFGDETIVKSIEWGKRVDILVRTAGGNGNRRAVWAAENDPIQQHRVIPAGDPYVPCANNPTNGADDGSEKPEQYGVCDGRGAPDWTYTVQAPLPGIGGGGGVALLFSRGEIARAEMNTRKDGLLNTWTDLFDKTTGVMEGLSGARIFHQHSVGVALTPSYTENALDIDTSVGISTAASDQPHQVLTALASLSVTEEALAIGQLATERPGSPGSPIQDTAARRMSPGTGLVILSAPGSTSGLPTSVSADTKVQIESYLTKGFQVVVNTTTNLNAFLARRADGSEQAWIIRAQTFGASPDVDPRVAFRKGAVDAPPNPLDYLGKAEARQLAANVAGTRLGSVDLRNGTLSFSEGTELSIGQGDFPYSLGFSRSYSSTGPVEGPSGLGMGWTHNWESSVSRSSDVNALTPDAEAVTAAPMLMAAMIALEAGRANTVEASVVSGVALDWLQNQAAYNVANVNGGGQSARFVRLVNGTWRNPASAADALTPAPGITDSIYNKQYDWRLSDRSVMAFRDIPNTAPGQFDMGLQGALVGWTFPTGVEITLTYGGQDRTNRPSLTSVFNNVGAKLEFTHSRSASYEDTDQCYRAVILQYQDYRDGYREAQQACYDESVKGGRLENVKAGPDQISFGHNPFCTQNVNFCAVELISADRPGQRKREYVYGTPAGALATAFSPADYQQVLTEVRDANVTTPRARFVWVATGGQVAPYVAESRDAQDRKTTYYSSTFTYSAAQDATNAIVRQTYDEDGRLTTSADAMGRVSQARYDGPGRTAWLKTAFGDTTTFTYDRLGNLIKREQAPIEGCATGLTVEQQAWWCQTIIIEARYTNVAWPTKPTHIDLPATAADPNVRTWVIAYNGQGLTASITAPQVPDGAAVGAPMTSPVWTTEYDNRGRPTATVDPTGVRTTMTYTTGPAGWADCMTQQVQGAQSATDKITTTFTCDLVGNVLTTTVGGATTTATYDEFRRKRSEDGPAGTDIRSRWEYNIDGDLAETKRWDTAGGGRWLVTLTDYSATHQPLTVREPGPTGAATGDLTRTCYDAVDRPVAVIDGERRATRTVYNAAGQPTEIHRFQRAGVNSCGMVTELPGTDFTETRWRRFQYNAGGLQSAEIDARGNTTQQIYDGLGRPAKLLYADGTQSWTAQDQRGQGILHRQPSGHRASIFYDAAGRDYHVREYAEADKDYKWRGRNSRAAYDLSGRPVWRDVSTQTTLTTTFDDALRRDIRNYAYVDGLGRLTSEQWRPEGAGGISYTTGYDYADGRGNRTSINQPKQGGGNWTISYAYDLANRVQSVSFPSVGGAAQTVAISHDSLGRRTGIDRPGLAADSNYTYETDNDLLTLAHGFTAGSGPGRTTFTFGHDASSKVTSIAIDQPAFEWMPSPMDENYGAASVMNRISSVAGTAVTWDGNGNMRSDGVNTYTWTYGNRMAGASRAGMTATYDYDSDDRRTKKVVNGVMTRTMWSGSDELAEYDAAGGLLRRFVPDGTGTMDARLATVEFNSATEAATGLYWHHTDHQGSVIATSDGSGQTVGTATYSPYGEFAAGTTAPPAHSPFGYAGRQYDPETGLYQYRARYYSPRLGQFLSTDPIGTKEDPNLYLYVRLDPVNATDPTGECIASHIDTASGSICQGSAEDEAVDPGVLAFVDGAAVAAAEKAAEARAVAAIVASRLPALAGGTLTSGVGLAMIPTDLGEGQDQRNSYVVRAGITTAANLDAATRDSVNGHGYSVQSRYNTPWQELARGGRFPNGQVSVARMDVLNSIPGVHVIVGTPAGPLGGDYHSTVVVDRSVAPPNVFELMNAAYSRRTNLWRVERPRR